MSSTPLDSSVLRTRQRAEALSKALSSIMHVGLIPTLTALKKPTSIWVTKISSIFQLWLSLYEGGSFVPQERVCAWTRACARAHACGVLLEVCCWTTVLDLLTNNLKSVQAGASLHAWVTVLMSSFHAVLCRLARWRCRFTILLLQICVLEYMCRIKPAIETRWDTFRGRKYTFREDENRQSPASKKSVRNCFVEMTQSGQLRPPSLPVSGSLGSESRNHPFCSLWNEFYFMWFKS